MPDYRVRWEIDIVADNPREAAEKALAIQRDPKSTATFFEVCLHGSEADFRFGESIPIDFNPEA